MKRLMIGQFNNFNKDKQERDFRESFFGVEACLMQEEKDILELVAHAKKQEFQLGIHFPLRANQWIHRDPQFLSRDEEARKQSYAYMENELDYVNQFNPTYILIHYPKPVIIHEQLDLSKWRFGHSSEYDFEAEYNFDVFAKEVRFFFNWLNDKANQYEFIPVLELDFINEYTWKSSLLEDLLKEYPRIKLCLDIARLHLQDELDEEFDPFSLVERYSKYTELVHLSNGRVVDNFSNNHYPALPTLKTDEGWADVERYLSIINQSNNTYKILFEHRSEVISDEELDACYEWVTRLINSTGENCA
ncbi:TIM barrel protein [Vallitalea okinawensis]|uniref:TIM barrel protein n=1 Tax=Vallitalea okinawensis TaxID=2078660 RepID=UPI000CFBF50B|nr:TIM barrel protein [Vallitalea okinawensis]